MEQYENFPFGDGREHFNTDLKYLNKLIENTWGTKVFESNIFVIYKVLPKFTKILSHEYLELNGIIIIINACITLVKILRRKFS